MLYSKNIELRGQYDLIVCGGGFSGFSAAYSAAKEGLKVLLIERNSALGGVGTLGLVNHILGERFNEDGKVKTCVGGLFSHLENKLLERGWALDFRSVDRTLPPQGWKPSLGVGLAFDKEKMKLLLEEMLTEVKAELLYMTDVVDVLRRDERLTGVVVHNKNGLYGIQGTYFVDATGDGDLCAMAGLPYAKGDENGGMSAASLEMHFENVDGEALKAYMDTTHDVRFREIIGKLKEQGLWHFPYEIFISVLMMKEDVYFINTIRQVGIDGTDASSVTRGITDGRKECFELLDTARNYFPGFQNATIREIAPIIGIRETRRIQGEYTLTNEDLVTAKDFSDGIALSGHGWDMPHPQKPSYQPFSHKVMRKSPVTQIPYRAMVPKGIGNLIAVGRCISVEREALGPVRVMAPCIAMGQAAGIATALAFENRLSYMEIDITLLRKKITDDGGIVSREQIKENK